MADLRAQLLAAFEIEHREHLDAIRRALADPSTMDVREVFRRAHSLKGAARAVDLPIVEELAHHLEELFARIERGEATLTDEAADAIHQNLDAIESAAARESVPSPSTEKPVAPASRADETDTLLLAEQPAAAARAPHEGNVEYLRVDAATVRELSHAIHQVAGELQAHEATLTRLRTLQADMRRLERLWTQVRPRTDAVKAATGTVEFETVLRSVTGELGSLAQTHRRASWSLQTSVDSLRSHVEEIALTPAATVLGDLGRIARDLARQSGVAVDVRVEGLEVSAERRVLQALKDPILHLMRNALSHGVEPPEARRAADKPERMLVGVEMTAVNGRLQVRIFDDGAGPNLERIEAAAIERGLLQRRKPDEPPPSTEELLALAFEPGVSSSAGVDQLSGRGMGLSVVMEAVRALGGSARLTFRQPAGAVVTVSAPLSTARQAVVLIEAAGGLFGLPNFAVARLLRIPRAQLEFVEGSPVVRIGINGADVLTPVAPLASLLTRAPAEMPVSGDAVSALLLSRDDRHVALAVDALLEVREIVIEAIEALGVERSLTLGAGLVGDDAPVVVLDPDTLFDRWLRDERRLASAGLGLAVGGPAEKVQTKTVLVVDDSFTTRTLEKSILEAQGYGVLLAVDGVDALNTLRSGAAVIDLVVADIEMPRMDGFALLQAIKADASLSGMPVILMTSRDDPEDVRRGMDLGAEAYITKQKFDQRELLATIGRIL